MKGRLLAAIGLLAAASVRADAPPSPAEPATLQAQRAHLLDLLRDEQGLEEDQLAAVAAIFNRSSVLGQGNPAITRRPMTRDECQARRAAAGLSDRTGTFESVCGAPYMAPLYDPASERPADAAACIDQYEFPGVPCAYPVVWVRTAEAAAICEAMDKRLCDAHEWEGACAGALEPPDYRFDLARGKTASAAVGAMRSAHNAVHAPSKTWSYGSAFRTGVCAQASQKSAGCAGGEWKACGSNHYPTGAFADCKSALEVYDLNGNAAEHLNLPLAPDEMASTGSTRLGVTEMKGSWFIWDSYRAHEDWCRWRAPYWHGSPVRSPDSHHNYHLGFRCCKTIRDEAGKRGVEGNSIRTPDTGPSATGEPVDVDGEPRETTRWKTLPGGTPGTDPGERRLRASERPEIRALGRIPPRPEGAPSGSRFAGDTASLDGPGRQARAVEELLSGNVPDFLRRLVPVGLRPAGTARGSTVEPEAWIWVLPDYLAIGSDDDFLRFPLTLPRALEVARAWDMYLPTRKMVDAVYRQADVRLSPRPMTPGPRMRSSDYYLRHQRLIEEARGDRPLGALTAGHKKDVVLTRRLLRQADRIAIYGWHRTEADAIQPLSTVHDARYADYSHGVRLVDSRAIWRGQEGRLDGFLTDPEAAGVFSLEGGLPRTLLPKR